MILSKEFSVCLIKPRGVQKQINTIDDKTAGLWAAVTALRHELHRNPELSGEEIETKKRLMAFIRTQTHLKIVDQGDWFYALYEPAEQNGEAPVAFRADMDALPVPETIALPYGSVQPNVAHKCGHDGHAAAALGLTVADMPEPWRPSEDFAWYTQVRPGAMFYMGNGIHWPMLHQPGFDFNDRILRTITSVFLKLAETR